MTLGHTRWAIAEGYLPEWSVSDDPRLISHETICMLNAGDRDAKVSITLYFADRNPLGPYHLVVPKRRTRHLRLDELQEPARVPRGTDFASVIESTAPIVVQHTRLDSRNPNLALLSTVAYAGSS